MLAVQIGEKRSGEFGTSCFYIFIAVADSLNSFCKVLTFPLQIGS